MTEITATKNINSTKNPIKKCFKIGSLTVTTIDESIVEEMKINNNTTFFEQEITEDGILLRVRDITF